MPLYKASYQTDNTDIVIGYFKAQSSLHLLTHLEINIKTKGYGFKVDPLKVNDISLIDYDDLDKDAIDKLRKRMLALDKLTPEDKQVLGLK